PAPGREEVFGNRRRGVQDPSSRPRCPAEALRLSQVYGWIVGPVPYGREAEEFGNLTSDLGQTIVFRHTIMGSPPTGTARATTGEGAKQAMGQVSKVAPRGRSDAALRTRAPDQLDPLALYLDAMGRYPLLTDVDEVELAKAIEAGKQAEAALAAPQRKPIAPEAEELQATVAEGRAAKRRFIQSNLRLVVS